MLDADRCRGTASRYAKLATVADRALVRQACRNLERLWLELADVTEAPGADQSTLKRRRDVLMANIDSQRRLTSHYREARRTAPSDRRLNSQAFKRRVA